MRSNRFFIPVFLFTVIFGLISFSFFLPFVVRAQGVSTPTPTITPRYSYGMPTLQPFATAPALDCPSGPPEGYLTVTPPPGWLAVCGQCLPTLTPYPTSVPPTATEYVPVDCVDDNACATQTAAAATATSWVATQTAAVPTATPAGGYEPWYRTAKLVYGHAGSGVSELATCDIVDAQGFRMVSLGTFSEVWEETLQLPASGHCIYTMTSPDSFWDLGFHQLSLQAINFAPGSCAYMHSVGNAWAWQDGGYYYDVPPADAHACYGDPAFVYSPQYYIDNSLGLNRTITSESTFEIGRPYQSYQPTPTPTPGPGGYCSTIHDDDDYLDYRIGDEIFRDCYELPHFDVPAIMSTIDDWILPQIIKDAISSIVSALFSLPRIRYCFSYRDLSLVLFGVRLDLAFFAALAIVYASLSSLLSGLVGRMSPGQVGGMASDIYTGDGPHGADVVRSARFRQRVYKSLMSGKKK